MHPMKRRRYLSKIEEDILNTLRNNAVSVRTEDLDPFVKIRQQRATQSMIADLEAFGTKKRRVRLIRTK